MTLHQILDKQVANFSVLFVKLHHFHWYVKGPEFFTLHTKFEELYNEAAMHVDTLAERLLTIGGAPSSTMKQYLEISSIQEAQGNEKAREMVQTLVEDYTTIVKDLLQGMELADEAKDEATGDLLLSIKDGIEKHNWMLRAYLG